MEADLSSFPKLGALLCDRYEVTREIGRGGMATVFEAFDRVRQDAVALKLISPQLRSDPVAEQRFIDEAILTSRLNHPRIINVHDIEHSECGILISMELLRGRTLRAVLEDRQKGGGRMPVEEVIGYVRQIGEGLEYAHLFTVHRDLKPENIWVDRKGRVKLMDFGLAKRPSHHVSARTHVGASMGTPYYIAPEQLSDSSDVGPAADQYSLAAIAYELLTGEVPAGVPRPIHVLRTDVPRRLNRVVARGLARDPSLRFASVMDFTAAFCEPDAFFRKHLSSPQRLALAASVFFFLGVITVAILEQAAALTAGRGDDNAADWSRDRDRAQNRSANDKKLPRSRWERQRRARTGSAAQKRHSAASSVDPSHNRNVARTIRSQSVGSQTRSLKDPRPPR